MFKTLLKNIYKFLGVFVTLYTIIGIFISIFSEEYSLEAYVKNERKISEFFLTNLIIENTGESLKSEDFLSPIKFEYDNVIDSVWIDSKSNDYISSKILKKSKNSFEFVLVNFSKGEKVSLNFLTKKKLSKPKIFCRINNIENIKFYHYKFYPKLLNRINLYWVFLSLIGLFMFFDMLLVLKKDNKLQLIYNQINSLKSRSNKDKFLEKLKEFYINYDVRIKFVKDEIIFEDFKNILFSSNDIDIKKQKLIFAVNGSVLYYTRANFGILGFLIFIVSVCFVLGNIFYFEILNFFN